MKKLFYHLKRGKLMFIGKPIFTILVNVELCWEKVMDMLFASKFNSNLVDENLTAVIKTFERPKELIRLVKSIKQFYPEMKIIVVDDSQNPFLMDGVETFIMPFDSGVSAGRQEALKHVETKYLLLLDDDYVFYRKTVLEPALKRMESHEEIDIMGGARVDLPLYRICEYLDGGIYPTKEQSCKQIGSRVADLRVQDKVANFYIGKVESIKKVGWDESLKRLDHADFFTRAKGVLTTVFNPEFKVLHAQTPYSKVYMEKRNAYSQDQERIYEKYYQ